MSKSNYEILDTHKPYGRNWSDFLLPDQIEFIYKAMQAAREDEREKLVILTCMVCGEQFIGYEPKMCCSGDNCGCMGLPIDPVVCSDVCYGKGMNGGLKKEKLETPIVEREKSQWVSVGDACAFSEYFRNNFDYYDCNSSGRVYKWIDLSKPITAMTMKQIFDEWKQKQLPLPPKQ